MAAAIPWIVGAGTVLQAAGTIAQGEAANRVAEQNAQIAERNAVVARQQAAADAKLQRRDARRRLGAIRAAYGASGVVGTEGSALEVLEDSAAQLELDALTTEYKGELRALGLTETAAMDRAKGRFARDASYLQAGSELLLGGYKTYKAMP